MAPTAEEPRSALPASGAPGARDDEALRRELAALVARERPRLLAFLRRRVGPSVSAEDVLHEGLLRALARVETVSDPARLGAWLYRVLRNEAHDHTARASRERPAGLAPDDLGEPSPHDEPRACCCSLALLPTLRPEQEDLLRRVDLGGEPLERVAGTLGLTKNATTVRLHRARKALRELWAATCGTSGARSCGDCACPK